MEIIRLKKWISKTAILYNKNAKKAPLPPLSPQTFGGLLSTCPSPLQNAALGRVNQSPAPPMPPLSATPPIPIRYQVSYHFVKIKKKILLLLSSSSIMPIMHGGISPNLVQMAPPSQRVRQLGFFSETKTLFFYTTG